MTDEQFNNYMDKFEKSLQSMKSNIEKRGFSDVSLTMVFSAKDEKPQNKDDEFRTFVLREGNPDSAIGAMTCYINSQTKLR